MNLAEIEFDQDDQNLFQIDDLRLKADAIRHSILPKLNLLLNQAILRIKKIYDVEVLEDSHIAHSPNFRLTRNNDLKVDYHWAGVALTGKRTREKWYGFERKNAKPVQIVPFEYRMLLLEEGLSFNLICHRMKGLSGSSYSKLFRFHVDYEKEIHPLCYLAEIKPVLYWGEGCQPCAPFSEHYQWMIENNPFNMFKLFGSKNVEIPVTADKWADLIDRFVLFYPVYDSYVQIAKGEKVRLDLLIEKLNNWLKEKPEEPKGSFLPAEGVIETVLEKARELAEKRVRVMPAIRWQVFQRDAWKCVACGRGAADNAILHIDHIVPRSKGGSGTLDNYQTLCNVCNLGKSNKDNNDLRRQHMAAPNVVK
jgi:hypothetical protein